MNRGRATVVAVLGSTQTLAWASSYYVPAILGVPIAAGLGVAPSVFFGAFWASLVFSAAVGGGVGPRVVGGGAWLLGRALPRRGALPDMGRVPRPPPPLPSRAPTTQPADEDEPPRGAMPILAFYFATTAFVTGAMAAHLPRLLESAGASEATPIFAGTLVVPAQVAARLCQFGLLRPI